MKKRPEVTAITRQHIMDAFWSLYKEKRIEKISINEITRISGNNRTTFYHYFLDVYDLLEQLEIELLEELNGELKKQFEEIKVEFSEPIDFRFVFNFITPIFLKYEEKLFILLGSHGDQKFSEMLRSRMKENLVTFTTIPADTKYIDYIINFIYSSMIGMLSFWYERNHDISEKEFIELAPTLIAYGVLGFGQNNS
ncbi:MAG: TetR/AcrR family transcriptional regulator [Ruminococcus sp.]|nr:TetR/AcrR family transcriptional regulator [Ruminococcus sp.]